MKKPEKIASLPKLLSYILSALILGSASISSAQPRHAQSGEISFEADAKTNYFAVSKDTAYAYVTDSLTKLRAGSKTLNEPSDNDLSYVNAVYLYCTINNGTCPAPLNALYEIDLLNAYESKKAECPILTKFWKLWLANGYEERQKYSIKTAHIGTTSNFTNKIRPQYIKCAQTIKNDLDAFTASPELALARFNSDGAAVDALTKLEVIMKTIRDNNIDVFKSLGIGTQQSVPTEIKKKK